MQELPGVSIVIICLNEADYVEECLDALLAASDNHTPYEIVVVDGGSTDGTVACVRAWEQTALPVVPLRIVSCAPGYSGQRNAGVRAASHEWIAFLSADVRVPGGWMREVAKSLDSRADLLIGKMRLVEAPHGGRWMNAVTATIYPTLCDLAVERCSTAHVVVRRECLLAQPFTEELSACEDKDMAYRILAGARGSGALTIPIPARHLARESVPRFLRKLWRESRELAGIARRYGTSFPDCFGWRAHSRRSLQVAALALVLLLLQQQLAAGVVVIGALALGAFHWRGWSRRRGKEIPTLMLALLHAAAMLSIVAGYACALPRPRIRPPERLLLPEAGRS